MKYYVHVWDRSDKLMISDSSDRDLDWVAKGKPQTTGETQASLKRSEWLFKAAQNGLHSRAFCKKKSHYCYNDTICQTEARRDCTLLDKVMSLFKVEAVH